ncbi:MULTISPECIES: YihY/virulence factor BrkB family protein [Maribacter]|mgnify:CR=1 FL=1|uniref:Membrane protein n=1 Tax=Maribacter stanieri TaxID=440514 RepID=A0A1I6J7A6_9FLAO|nr:MULTISPECIES: YihY/virulence factor BrkB family protein [Maribacter]SFR74849.1 membrane protein [Maribacter stanieri]|tara:strand:- start:1000 stop:1968 length:969 start_codon:yes stop_codon:yes gene_type:complete|eukprot:TRINITY_DN1603_c0_g1_i6.p1 TRINITY_DN1603_c0_g1~~TRINITY_DN1603_c0_g1_i6.p1  ORF type:complete len:323 (+),score=53.93 TRINITY_DN1603_c0_g1_i6:1095-2063(+)
MSLEVEEKLEKIPIINWFVLFLKKIRLPGFEGLSVYDLIEMYVLGILRGTLSTRASAIAFSLFMALFPLIIFMVTLVPFLLPYISIEHGDFEVQFRLFLESFLPNATGDYFGEVFQQIKDQKRGGLLSSSFLLSIFLVANGVNAIFGGFETSYHIDLTRHFFRQYLYALMVGLILSILILVGFVAFIYFEFYVLGYLSEFAAKQGGYILGEDEVVGVQIAKVLFFIILSYFTTAILYYFGTREGRQAKFFSFGALMTTTLFLITSYLFGIYVEKFARYNELYGALGGLLILMVYIWLNSNILLLGFELNASLNTLRKITKKE